MITMQRINKFFGSSTISNHVKEKAMSNVFKQSPEKHTTEKNKNNAPGCNPDAITAVIHHVNHNWQVHSPYHQWMGFGQHFKVWVFKKLCLAFIINFSGNFFLFLYSKNSFNDEAFQRQYTIIYSTVTILKNILLCISIPIKEHHKGLTNNTFDSLFDNFHPFQNKN